MGTTAPLPRMIGALLRIPFQQTVERVFQRLQEEGYTDLRPAHFVVMQHMRPEGVRITELAHRAQMTKQSMGALVDYAEERGYVERTPDPNDGRAWLIRLTPRGRETEQIARAAIGELETEWAQYLGEERFSLLRSTLEDLVTFVESHDEARRRV